MGTTLTLQNRRVQGYQDTGEQEDYLMGMWESNGVGGGNNKQPAQQLQVRKCMRLECILRASTPKKNQPKLKNKAKHAFYYILGFLKVWVTISGHRKLVVLQSCTMHTILTRSGIHMLKGIMKIGLVLVNRFLCDQGSSRSASTWLSPLSFVGPQPTQNSLSNSPRTQQRKLKDKKP